MLLPRPSRRRALLFAAAALPSGNALSAVKSKINKEGKVIPPHQHETSLLQQRHEHGETAAVPEDETSQHPAQKEYEGTTASQIVEEGGTYGGGGIDGGDHGDPGHQQKEKLAKVGAGASSGVVGGFLKSLMSRADDAVSSVTGSLLSKSHNRNTAGKKKQMIVMV